MLFFAITSFVLGCLATGFFIYKYKKAARFYKTTTWYKTACKTEPRDPIEWFKIWCLIISPTAAVLAPVIWIVAIAVHCEVMGGVIIFQFLDVAPIITLLCFYLPALEQQRLTF